ncbi:PaaI family thioesterase [Sphingomonas rhizophila]|uniref:PaaI family thioesterase n=1 Tax=Sphingomonas rhizophila TaxID=2071607 RepID=A0A7G9SDL4_9SPHN|nr:PaaI family thioesterase [Sphingomonas rhizophila]QNN65939.1 PaaI family thioesterase [Sphingomonas rhizophila]
MSRPPEEVFSGREGSFDPAAFFALARTVGHGRALGLDFRNAGENWVELALPWREELVGVPDTGVLASGAIVSLLDTCGGASVWQSMRRFQHLATIDLRLDYFKPAQKGETVIARCHCDKLTRQIAFVSGIAHIGDPAHPVARATGTFMINP